MNVCVFMKVSHRDNNGWYLYAERQTATNIKSNFNHR